MPDRNDLLFGLAAANRGLATDLQLHQAARRQAEGGAPGRDLAAVLAGLGVLSDGQVRDLANELRMQAQRARAQPPPLPAGSRLGSYRLVELVRSAPGKALFRARSEVLGTDLALKVFLPQGAEEEAEVERWKEAARASTRVRVPGVLPYLDVGSEGLVHFVAVEWAEAVSLADLPDRRRPGLLPPVQFFLRLAEGLQALGAAGVAHGNLAPGNLLLDLTAAVRLADFRQVKDARRLARVNAVAMRDAALHYFAPELAAGAGPADVRSDVFSYGALLYEGLTNRPPFPGPTTGAILATIQRIEPEPPRRADRAVHPALEAICMKALEKEPGRRYGSFAEIAQELVRLQQGREVLAQPVTRVTFFTRKLRARRRLVGGVVVGGLLLLGAFGAGEAVRRLAEVKRALFGEPEPAPPEVPALRRKAWPRQEEGIRQLDVAAGERDLGLRAQRARRAVEEFTAALECDPTYAEALYGRARAHGLLDHPKAALADLDHGLKLEPTLTVALEERVRVRIALSAESAAGGAPRLHLESAVLDLDRLLETAPERADLRLLRAQLLVRLERDAAALEELDRLIGRNPTLREAWRLRGEIRLRVGVPGPAAADLRRYLELAPDDPEAAATRALLAEAERQAAERK